MRGKCLFFFFWILLEFHFRVPLSSSFLEAILIQATIYIALKRGQNPGNFHKVDYPYVS